MRAAAKQQKNFFFHNQIQIFVFNIGFSSVSNEKIGFENKKHGINSFSQRVVMEKSCFFSFLEDSKQKKSSFTLLFVHIFSRNPFLNNKFDSLGAFFFHFFRYNVLNRIIKILSERKRAHFFRRRMHNPKLIIFIFHTMKQKKISE